MLKGFLALSAVAFAGAPQDAAPDLDKIVRGDFTQANKAHAALHVVDWNIDRGTRLHQVTGVLEGDEPDLCLLQEVDLSAKRSGVLNVAEEIAKSLKLRYAYASAWAELGQREHDRVAYQGQAILTRLPIKTVRVIRFQTQSNFWKPKPYLPNWGLFQRRLGGRIAIVAELEFNGHTLVVYNTHLESRSTGVEKKQMDEILKDAQQYPESTPIILAGDFNTKYNARSMGAKLREGGWRSAFGTRTPKTHVIMFALDWMMVRGPLRIEQGKVEHGSHGSDHLPVSANVSIAEFDTRKP